MTQLIACSTHEGIVLATDSVATRFDPSGDTRHFKLKKLLRLNSYAAMVSAGAGIGVEMGNAFQRFVQDRKVDGIEEIFRFAFPFFTDEYGKYLKEERTPSSRYGEETENAHEEAFPLTGIYIILAGYSFKDRLQSYHLQLLGNDEEGEPIRIYPTTPILVIPRSLSMERRLAAQREGGASLDQLLYLSESFLKKRSEDEEVGPPFHFATITSGGFKEIIKKERER